MSTDNFVGRGTPDMPIDWALILDFKIVPVGKAAEHAFMVLYSSFHAFNIHYPKFLRQFYKFFNIFVFKLPDIICPFSSLEAKISAS